MHGTAVVPLVLPEWQQSPTLQTVEDRPNLPGHTSPVALKAHARIILTGCKVKDARASVKTKVADVLKPTSQYNHHCVCLRSQANCPLTLCQLCGALSCTAALPLALFLMRHRRYPISHNPPNLPQGAYIPNTAGPKNRPEKHP
ncbi:hypothetical protein C8Q77DRAFT_1110239 [Trametes polyzona]|nr:hypothetical protein C8Q77DRAFT_1110239 [Trametes polyzona]